jgi:3-oxoacyl-[acyl-carrier-protein] synthase II
LKEHNQGATVAVTGFGLMTPFGFGGEAAVRHLFAGEDKFGAVTRFDTGRFRSSIAAESGFTGRFLELGMLLADEAIRMAGLDARESAVSVLLGTMGDYGELNRFWRERLNGSEDGGRTDPSESLPAYHTAAMAERFGLRGRQWTFTNACIASSSAIASACELIAQGRDNVALCGGYSLVTEEIYAKFNSGRAFSKDGKVRSFSLSRSGMLLGDGGAMFVLENAEHARRRGARVLAEIAGWGIANDAFHVCQPDPGGGGMSRAMEKALRRAGIRADEVGYINAHGTGTPLNDSSETRAVKRVFGAAAYRVPVTSTKTMTGHMLDGTGAVETAITMMAMNAGVIPPTAGFTEPDPDCDLDYVPCEARRSAFRYAINLNAAFGGCNSAIVLKKTMDGGIA